MLKLQALENMQTESIKSTSQKYNELKKKSPIQNICNQGAQKWTVDGQIVPK